LSLSPGQHKPGATSDRDTLLGRNPACLTVRASLRGRWPTSRSVSAIAMVMESLRSRLPVFSSWVAMSVVLSDRPLACARILQRPRSRPLQELPRPEQYPHEPVPRIKVVRPKGLEPSRQRRRQDLNLVRLPIPPRPPTGSRLFWRMLPTRRGARRPPPDPARGDVERGHA